MSRLSGSFRCALCATVVLTVTASRSAHHEDSSVTRSWPEASLLDVGEREPDDHSTDENGEKPAWLTDEVFQDENGTNLYNQGFLQRKASLVMDWVHPGAKVLELGGRYGVVTCALARRVSEESTNFSVRGVSDGQVVAVEPDATVWSAWHHNTLTHCPGNVHLMEGAISKEQLYAVHDWRDGFLSITSSDPHVKGAKKVPVVDFAGLEEAQGVKFDTLYADCQGCVLNLIKEYKDEVLHGSIATLIIEEDGPTDEKYHFSEEQKSDYAELEQTLLAAGFIEMHRTNDKEDDLHRVVFQKHGATAQASNVINPHLKTLGPCFLLILLFAALAYGVYTAVQSYSAAAEANAARTHGDRRAELA